MPLPKLVSGERKYRTVSGSRKVQSVSPVAASMATTWRRCPKTVYSTPSTKTGVERTVYSTAGPKLSPRQVQATSRSEKLDALIWSSIGADRVFPASPPR